MSQAYRTLVGSRKHRPFVSDVERMAGIMVASPTLSGDSETRVGAEEVAVGVGPRRGSGRAFFAFSVGPASSGNDGDPE